MVRLPLRAGRPTRAVPATAVCLALALSLTACSGDDEPEDGDPPSTSASPSGPPPIETVARLGEVVGDLDKQKKARLKTKVAEVVDAWIDAAYLGDFPRTDFSDAFPGFTKGAAADATTDAALMTNKRFAADLEQVVATRREVVVDALAVRKHAVAATARFVLAMTLDGGVHRRERVRGRLFLTYDDGAWRVFGYDVNRGRGR
ncbi:hypothetical protein SAMN05192576_3811 [Nocardioides szechwanensis]|uniref:SnoaL-like domain-containing protein n=1 Tax=Nocardioides szechwanensis TaxID=1005944 RepID=A0A1H0IIC1_9ACTN|nr:hypothetical protein [Nocardioides szechwanensis]SDO31194.1 hypothetical protein SAMN05192576_3811 [Nocardioides szechwanensis]